MKKLSMFIMLLTLAALSYAQTAVNADGTLKLRANVAIYVDLKTLQVQNGKVMKADLGSEFEQMKTVMRTLAMQKFADHAIGIVNRDDEANKQVQALLKENKMEDYMSGIQVTAKGQGADYLFVVEQTVVVDGNAGEFMLSARLINVENNMAEHFYYRTPAIALTEEESMRSVIRKNVHAISTFIDETLYKLFPEQYFVAKSDGKKWQCGAYTVNGTILPTDKFYAFKFTQENMTIGQASIPIQVLDRVAVCDNPTASGGYLQVKADRTVSDFSNIVLFRNLPEVVFGGTNCMRTTLFGLDYTMDSYDGLIKSRINNALYSALTRHVGAQVIEHDHLKDIQAERELQKGEDFIDGHVVEQMKAIGADYLLRVEQYSRNDMQVSLKLSIISVAENRILKVVDVTSSVDNLENEMYKQICERFSYPCVVKAQGKNEYEISSVLSLPKGTECILQLTKAVTNHMNQEVSYSVSQVCMLEVTEYRGNKCLATVKKVLDKEGLANIESLSASGLVTFIIDGTSVKSDFGTESNLQEANEQIEKKEKRKNFWNKVKEAGKDMLKNATIRTNVK